MNIRSPLFIMIYYLIIMVPLCLPMDVVNIAVSLYPWYLKVSLSIHKQISSFPSCLWWCVILCIWFINLCCWFCHIWLCDDFHDHDRYYIVSKNNIIIFRFHVSKVFFFLCLYHMMIDDLFISFFFELYWLITYCQH